MTIICIKWRRSFVLCNTLFPQYWFFNNFPLIWRYIFYHFLIRKTSNSSNLKWYLQNLDFHCKYGKRIWFDKQLLIENSGDWLLCTSFKTIRLWVSHFQIMIEDFESMDKCHHILLLTYISFVNRIISTV